jgi:predicted nuclease of predicted toxin-antitoxin system
MRILADENFPQPAIEALRTAGWDVFSIREESPGISDEEVAALCSAEDRILVTFDKDFGELIFRRRLAVGAGVILFRLSPESPAEVAALAMALVDSGQDLRGHFCVVTRDRIRLRPFSRQLPPTPFSENR